MSLPVTLLCVLHCVTWVCKGGCITLREEAVVMEPRMSVTTLSEAGRSKEACIQVPESL